MTHPRVLFFLVLLILPACPAKPGDGPMKSSGEPPIALVPCFPESGPVLFDVDGVPVPAATVERFAKLLLTREPALSEANARFQAVEQVIIPQAAVYSKNAGRRLAMSEIVRAAGARIAAGEPFSAVAKELSDDATGREKGGQLPALSRAAPGSPGLDASLEDALFTVPLGTVSEPVVTRLGMHLIRPIAEIPGSNPRAMQRTSEHIVIFYSAAMADRTVTAAGVLARQAAVGTFQSQVQAWTDAARVKLHAEAARALVYPFRIAK